MRLVFLFLCALSASPTWAKVMIVNGLTHTYTAENGQTLTGKIQLKNTGKNPDRVLIYKRDLMTDCGGTYDFVAANTHPRSIANWLTTNVDERILQPQEEYEVLYTIQVPKDSSLSGSYWSLLMVESDTPLSEQQEKGVSISSKTRYAIQVIADIGTENMPPIAFEKINMETPSDTLRVLHVKIKNDGKTLVKPKLLLDIFDGDGQKIKTFETPVRKLYPNTCVTFEMPLTAMPKGKFEGVLVADYGRDLFGTNLDIEIK
ncbi:MAG: hypothetical protein MUE30_04170 [Spirosomaceae bacterium]|nr:hypothetical protein [Spirosomataceae bacterium]